MAPAKGKSGVNLAEAQDLNLVLKQMIREGNHESHVCWHFLAGFCPNSSACTFQHPTFVLGWDTLYRHWGVTHHQFDYFVLDLLFKQPMREQDRVLMALANMDVGRLADVSLALFNLIQEH